MAKRIFLSSIQQSSPIGVSGAAKWGAKAAHKGVDRKRAKLSLILLLFLSLFHTHTHTHVFYLTKIYIYILSMYTNIHLIINKIANIFLLLKENSGTYLPCGM